MIQARVLVASIKRLERGNEVEITYIHILFRRQEEEMRFLCCISFASELSGLAWLHVLAKRYLWH